MPVIAVVNRKGGSGKSTLATHLASHYANAGVPVMLGDVDRQQSTQSWLRARALRNLSNSAPIVGWAVDPKRVCDRRPESPTSSSTRPAGCVASTSPASLPLPTSS